MARTYQSGEEASQTLHKRCGGGPYWFAGISRDPIKRLSVAHYVNMDEGHYGWVECASELVARAALFLLHNLYGYSGTTGGGSISGSVVFLYAYKITEDTDESLGDES